MAWYSNMLTPLRVLINDLDSTAYEYTDATLYKVLATAAMYVKREVNLEGYTEYTIEFSTPSISPDPSDDEIFTSFTIMKAACLLNQWVVMDKARTSGLTAKLGPVSMTANGGGSSIVTALLTDGYCAAYEEMKKQHNFGNVSGVKSILTPFSHSEIDVPQNGYSKYNRGI